MYHIEKKLLCYLFHLIILRILMLKIFICVNFFFTIAEDEINQIA